MPESQNDGSDILRIIQESAESGIDVAIHKQVVGVFVPALDRWIDRNRRWKAEIDAHPFLICYSFWGDFLRFGRRRERTIFHLADRRAINDCRDLFRSATLVLIDSLKAANLPYVALANLFTPDRWQYAQVDADLHIVTGVLLSYCEALKVKVKTREMRQRAAMNILDPPEQQRLSSTPADPKQLREYERLAYLSHGAAIQENSALARRPMRDIYDWIREHGVEIEGAAYEPPAEFATWQKYRRIGERLNKP